MKNLLSKLPKPTGQVLEAVGYAKGVAEQPNRLLQSTGFKEALAETGLLEALRNQGINPAKIASKIDYLLNAEDYNAVDKGLKHATAIYGVVDEKPKTQGNTYNFLFSEETQAKIRDIDNIIKQSLIRNEHIETSQENVGTVQ